MNFRGAHAGFIRMDFEAGMVKKALMRNKIEGKYVLRWFIIQDELR